VVVEFSVVRRVAVSCQVVAEELTLANVETVPSLSLSVKAASTEPVRVRSSAPGSGLQPPAVVLVKPVCSPLPSTRATEVAEDLRMYDQFDWVSSSLIPAVHCGPKMAT
jgi:hypothetical protein